LSPKEQAEVKEAKKKITQRLYDRMGSIIVDLKKMAHQKELAAA
jgi:C4-dicarboxylate-specific signal transduction histidine kinase